MNAPASVTVTPVRVADLLAEGERMPVYVHVIDHPDARVLVDTGITATRAARTTTPFATGSRRPACATCWSTASSSCSPGSDSSPRRATRGMQVVVVETGGRPVVVGGDVAVRSGELDEPHTEGQLRVRALNPELVWLAHEHKPWRPGTV